MQHETRDEILSRLKSDYAMKTSPDGKFLRYGKCPNCGKKELFVGAENPITVQCGRENNCGYQETTRNLYPDLFVSVVKRSPPTPQNPKATADAYLSEVRGLDIKRWHNCYDQETYQNFSTRHISPTIRFAITNPDNNTQGYWERLIDPAKDDSKAKIKTGFSIGGLAWLPPDMMGKLSLVKRIFITEGIFDAMALMEYGYHAISSISCNNYPHITLQQIKDQCNRLRLTLPTLVFAYDADPAGQRYTNDFIAKARQQGFDATAIQPPYGRKQDWNDLHKAKKLSPEDMENYIYYGQLLIAETAKDKAKLVYHRNGNTNFYITFDSRTYWVKIDIDKYDYNVEHHFTCAPDATEEETKQAQKNAEADALNACMTVTEIANCAIEPLYYQQNLITDESWYYIRIKSPKQADSKNTFTGSQLSSASEFKKRLLAVAPGVIYRGNSNQLDRILIDMISDIDRVETVDYIGYCDQHQAYIFNDRVIKNGVTYPINKDDFFELPNNVNIKTLAVSPVISIHERPKQPINWIHDIVEGWGVQGIVALTGFLGSLVVQQIRAKQKSYPFLEIVGEPGTGKSTLLGFFWRLIGRDNHEGIDPNKSTKAGRLRTLSQTSNMPTVLIESDRDNAASGGRNNQFNWDELKNLYDGGSIGTRGMKNSGNEVYEPPFRGSIIISQNLQVQASKAILSRICHLFFKTETQTRASEAAARRIESYEIEQVSHFLDDFLKQERLILETFFNSKIPFETWLKDSGVKSFRVAHCHAQLYAMFIALATHVLPQLQPYTQAIQSQLLTMAMERDDALNSENLLVIQFWDVYDRLSHRNAQMAKDEPLNHSKSPEIIAINMPQFYQAAREFMYDLPPQADIQEALRLSVHYKFIAANKVVSSRLENRSIRCWLFRRPATQAQ